MHNIARGVEFQLGSILRRLYNVQSVASRSCRIYNGITYVINGVDRSLNHFQTAYMERIFNINMIYIYKSLIDLQSYFFLSCAA